MKADFRHYLRRFIPRAAYQQLSNLASTTALLRSEGFGAVRAMFPYDGQETTLHLKSLRHPFTIQRISSHVDGIIQNIMRAEYDQWLTVGTPLTIIDAGAFIGDLTCHWATRYPNCRIISLEPNPDNFVFAQRNIAPYAPNVTLLNKGLWSSPGTLSVAGDEMASHLVDRGGDGATQVEVTDVPTLVREMNLSRIDILKLDIEGAEQEVLNAQSISWLPLVQSAVIEMHGKHIEAELIPRMQNAGFEARRHRSLIFFSRVPMTNSPRH